MFSFLTTLRADGDDEEEALHRKRTNSRRLTGKAGQPQLLVPQTDHPGMKSETKLEM